LVAGGRNPWKSKEYGQRHCTASASRAGRKVPVRAGEQTARGTRFAQTACQTMQRFAFGLNSLTQRLRWINERKRDSTFEQSSHCCKESARRQRERFGNQHG